MDMKKMNLSDRIIYILGLTLAGVLTFVVVAGVIVAVIKFYMDSKERTIQVQPGPALKDDPKLPSGNVSTGRHLSEDVNGQVNDEQEKPPNSVAYGKEMMHLATGNQGMSKFFSDVKRGFLNFAASYSIAVKSGADEAGKQIIEAMKELDQPSDIPAGKLFAAVKIGVQQASEHLVNSGAEFIEQMKKINKLQSETSLCRQRTLPAKAAIKEKTALFIHMGTYAERLEDIFGVIGTIGTRTRVI